MLVRVPDGTDGNATLETVFRRGDEEVGRNRQTFFVDPGKFGYRLVKGELEFPEPGTIEACCTIVEGGSSVTVPLTALPGVVIALNPGAGGRRSPNVDLVNSYAAALSLHPLAFEAVGETAGEIIEQFDGEHPDLVVCFASAAPHRRVRGRHATGCASSSSPRCSWAAPRWRSPAAAVEVEHEPGLSVFAARFGGGRVTGVALDVGAHRRRVRDRRLARRAADARHAPDARRPVLVPDRRLPATLQRAGARPAGDRRLASAARGPGGNRLVLDDRVVTTGAVGVMCSEDVPIRAVVSQGCRPIGTPLTITSAERNLVHELAGRPRWSACRRSCRPPTDADRELMREGLHVGIVVDEHRLDFERGDFLVRNLLGADQSTGSLAVGEPVEVGQTVQFQVRDAAAADEDLRACSPT